MDIVFTPPYVGSLSDTMILIVKGFARVSKKGSTIVVSTLKKDKASKENSKWDTQTVPVLDLELVVIVGSRVRISSGAIIMLAEANIPIIIHNRRSTSYLVNPFTVRIAEVRRRLYKIIEDTVWRVRIGREFIEGKLAGLANLVRYLSYKDAEKGRGVKWVLEDVESIEKARKSEVGMIKNIETLRVYEAKWSKKYWELLATFIPEEYEFTGRDPRGRDPVNSAISYAYAIIYGLCTHALIASGLDPYAGIIHSERAGKSSLTYDFSEMFKPLAMHAVITASRATTLSVDRSGYLTKKSLEIVTRNLYRLLKRKHRKWKYTARGEIYAKAWELRQNIEKGTLLKPFIYYAK